MHACARATLVLYDLGERACRDGVGVASLMRMSSTDRKLPEVTYVTTALGCRLPLARVLCCCRRMR